jgi:hypothetical protein
VTAQKPFTHERMQFEAGHIHIGNVVGRVEPRQISRNF